jgi:uncharacterized membrane protein
LTSSEVIDIQVPTDDIFDALVDIRTHPKWNKAVKEVHVLDEDEQGRPHQAQFQVDAVVKVLHYVIEYAYRADMISWKMVSGNMKRNAGSYQIISRGTMTQLIYTFDQDPGVPLPGMILQQGIKMGAKQMLLDFKQFLEAQSGTPA